MNMKKFLALAAAGVMVVGACMVVSAAPSSSSVSANSVSSSAGGSSTSAITPEQAAQATIDSAFASEVASSGVTVQAYTAAVEAGLTVEEYMNNSILEVPGLDEVTPVGQGGKIVLDGKVSNATFTMGKPISTQVAAAKSQAASLGGTVLNVVDLQSNVSFGTASVNFYMPGVKTGENVQVYRYTNGQWTALTVAEVRDDHVTVDMTSVGLVAFIQVP